METIEADEKERYTWGWKHQLAHAETRAVTQAYGIEPDDGECSDFSAISSSFCYTWGLLWK